MPCSGSRRRAVRREALSARVSDDATTEFRPTFAVLACDRILASGESMKSLLMSYAFVAFGGALGAMARFSLNVALQRDVEYPWGTLAANLGGCFVMGIIAHLVAHSAWFNETGWIPDQHRLLFAVGFCGSFTTLSALVLEMHTLFEKHQYLAASAYIGTSVLGGYVLFFGGYLLMRGVNGSSI